MAIPGIGHCGDGVTGAALRARRGTVDLMCRVPLLPARPVRLLKSHSNNSPLLTLPLYPRSRQPEHHELIDVCRATLPRRGSAAAVTPNS